MNTQSRQTAISTLASPATRAAAGGRQAHPGRVHFRTGDQKPGDKTGDGGNTVWRIAAP